MEALRQLVRNAVGYNTAPYRAAATALNTMHIVRREGLGMLSTVRRLRDGAPGTKQPVSFRNLEHPIDLRPGTLDISTVLDTVVREEYGAYLPDEDPLTMIDAGAFIGDTSAYFLSRFPDLRIWALEPNPDNFTMARCNLTPYGDRAQVLPFALAAREGVARFSGDGPGGSMTARGQEVRTTTIPALLTQIPGGHVDILKVDIEGAETEVFDGDPERWLPRIGLIIIELHGPEIEKSVLHVLRHHGFKARRYRSIWYCQRPE